MKRKNQVFCGELTDGELYLIEEALEDYTNRGDLSEQRINASVKLINKLYKFWEK